MPKKYVDDPFSIPMYQNPAAVEDMRSVWEKNAEGKLPTESSFVVHGRRPDGSPILMPVQDQHQYKKESFSIRPGDSDIVHTHPSLPGTDPKPSPADMTIADQHPGMGMYVMGRDGLYRYVKGMKEPELVQKGTDTSQWNTEVPADRRPDVSALPAVSRPLPQQEVPPLGRIGSPEEDAYKLKALPR